MITITYQEIKLKVETTEDNGQMIYRIIWPDDSRKFLLLAQDTAASPQWKYLGGESPKEARKIGKLVEEKQF